MMSSTNAVLYNVLSVLDLVGHGELMSQGAAHDEAQPSKLSASSCDLSRNSVCQEGGSRHDTIREISDIFLGGLPTAIRPRKKTFKNGSRSTSGTWGRNQSKQRPASEDLSTRTLPNKPFRITPQDISKPISDEVGHSMSVTYGKLIKLKKQKAELLRIYNMLEDLENDFLGDKDDVGSTYIERYMEVKVERDYALSPGNPESTLEQDETVKIFGYLGHNLWRCLGPYCKGYCTTSTIVNPRIRSQSIVGGIVCTTCNKITVPLIGAVPTSILNLQSNTPD